MVCKGMTDWECVYPVANFRALCSRKQLSFFPPGVSAGLRKIALKLKLKKVVEQQGDHYIIKTLSTFRNYTISFKVDQEFAEFTKGLDNRHVKSLLKWEGNKLVCEQIGEKKNRGWTHWVEDDKLHLELYCEGEVCKQVFKKNA